MKFGYARVSTRDQNLEAQLDALTAAGCDKIITEKASGNGSKERPELDRLVENLREGDTLFVYKLDRLGRRIDNRPLTAESETVAKAPKV